MLLLLLNSHRSDLEDGEQEGAINRLPLNSLDLPFNCNLGLLASAPGPGDDVLDKGVENDGVVHREVSKYPLDATTIALKIALKRRAVQKEKFECPRISYNIQDRFQGLEVEKAATDDDINEEGDDFKSKERIEEHNS